MDELRRIELDIAALTWPEFQRLVHDLVKKERPNALPLDAPDGGADTLIPAERGKPKEVVQAKHYPRPSRVKWSECRASVESALENHAPGWITFAFSRNFTKNDERNFREKLVEAFPQVDFRPPWTFTEVITRLEQHPDVKKRYFGREREDVLDSVLRAVAQGGKLETGADLIKRTRTLARFADEHDRDFEYVTSGGGTTMNEPKWNQLPFITMTVQDETTTVRVDAWAREGADVPPAGFSFTDDEAGRQAHAYAREELAQGRDAVLRQGVRFQVPNAPKLLREAAGGDTIEVEEITVRAGAPTSVEVEVETESETITHTFAVRPVPPREIGHVAFACTKDAVAVELDFQTLENPTVRFHFRLSGRFRQDVSANLEAARLLHAFYAQKRSVLRAERLFPNGELEGGSVSGTEDDEQSVAARVEIYRDLALIEKRTGSDFVIPAEGITQEDLVKVRTMATILETGEGTATFHNVTGVVAAHQIAMLADNTQGERILRQPLIYELFGERVDLGVGEYEIPPVRVIDVKPLGMKPDSPARVTLGPEGDDQMRFRLIGSAQAA